MADAIVRFEREDREGAAPVGSYLIDVMKRFGIPLNGECSLPDNEHSCAVMVTWGTANLSLPTSVETEHFKAGERTEGLRLACEAQIISVGEIAIMTEANKTEPAAETTKSKIVDDFEALPLERKLADLLRMEAVALGETLTFVANSPYLVIEKIGDVLAEFGMKMDRESKRKRSSDQTDPAAAGSPPDPVPHDAHAAHDPASPETGSHPS